MMKKKIFSFLVILTISASFITGTAFGLELGYSPFGFTQINNKGNDFFDSISNPRYFDVDLSANNGCQVSVVVKDKENISQSVFKLEPIVLNTMDFDRKLIHINNKFNSAI